MNQRIRLLAEQAKQETSLYGGKPGDREFDERFNKMFAELIVRECALVVHKKTGPKSALNVLEHFGVEE